MKTYLRGTEIIDWNHPAVLEIARSLSIGTLDLEEIARGCYHWVRDQIRHSYDYQLSPVTGSASEVVAARTGYCFAKSHLLAALLRANHIPAGFCYQRLSRDDNGPPFTLHGLVAVHLPRHGWYRIDPRGNRSGIDAQFTPPIEHLAFNPRMAGEADLPEIWPDPLPLVIDALRSHKTWDSLWENLPDIELLTFRST
ncbi:MAG: transglutaminase family protein [Deltaproteobacteria bacterium]|nr:transglutaminase family protein [Deltaproteobacteria bacterium]